MLTTCGKKNHTHKGKVRKKGGRHLITYSEDILRPKAKQNHRNKDLVQRLKVCKAAYSQQWKAEVTQVSLNGSVDKANVVYTYN